MNALKLYEADKRKHELAVHHARYYTQEQLQVDFGWATLGFYVAAIATALLMGFSISQWFAGDSWENLNQWRPIQFLYAFSGFGIASAIVIGEFLLLRSGRVREFILLFVVAVGFTVFAETAATMQREQQSVIHRSQNSEVFKTTIRAANNLADNVNISATQQKLATALAALDDTRASGQDTTPIQARINRLERLVEMERANNSALLSKTLNTARELEYDERNHQAIIKLMSELFNISYVLANGIFAFCLIVVFKMCAHYLGYVRANTERALSITEGAINEQFVTVWDSEYSQNTAKTASTLPYSNQQLSTESAVHVQQISLQQPLIDTFINDLEYKRVGLAVREVKDWISKNAKEQLALYSLQDVADELLRQAQKEGVIKLNPDYAEGNRKPKYIPA